MNAVLPLTVLLGTLVVTFLNVDAQKPTCSCATVRCGDRSISAEECKSLGGIPVYSYCGCCDSCETRVGLDDNCTQVRGVYPKPVCFPLNELTCINGTCVEM